ETKTVVELRSLAMHKDRAVRQEAYEKELDAWKSMEIPLAAALNGVKGFAVILDERRHYESSLDHAAFLSRVSPRTLDALIGVMEKNLPVFRKYLKAKAKLLGVKRCAFYDLYAPVGATEKEWSFADARKFIVEQFNSFSAELGEFAESAFKQGWIDAKPREGKVGGAFCTFMPLAGESRILANFDGSFDSVSTIAHELGHAYHGSVMKDLPALQQDYPMTLAETASIFCETIVVNRALESAESDNERIGVLELSLQGATAVIVDILSRFRFEKAVFERRKTGELSPAEFSDLMIRAQLDTYGDGLEKSRLHKYMWAVKGHYYSADLSFYNYPYAFGQLLGLALYANYTAEPQGFPHRYKKLLQLTGQATANEVTREAGFDIESAEFWQSGIDVIAKHVSEFGKLVTSATG
ncbi:MAG: M3 family oligoendopeptidase, partial [Spirochaetaceae bacterium]|nr:M3 family oligoendopeptidase [Spirochaetaceae bacterium]